MATRNLVSTLSRRLTSTVPKLNQKTVSPSINFTSTRRIPFTSRLPVELGSAVETMKPLHSAIASARLLSSLSIDSQGWCLVPQGYYGKVRTRRRSLKEDRYWIQRIPKWKDWLWDILSRCLHAFMTIFVRKI